MSDPVILPIHRPRLNPFAFPSDTTLRFVLLVIFAVCGGAQLYGDFSEDAQMDKAVSECMSTIWSKIDTIKTSSGEDAYEIATLGKETLSLIPDCSEVLRARVWWNISGICITITLALIIYWLHPMWMLKIGRLKPLPASELPEIDDELRHICNSADISSPPTFVWNPLAAGLPLIFGCGAKYYVAISGSFVSRFFYGDKNAFWAMILHELAHIRNGDVSKTWWVISLWFAFLLAGIAPSLAVVSWFLITRRWSDAIIIVNNNVLWTAVIVLSGLAVLRTREYYADVRASVWGGVSQINRALATLPKIFRHGWRRVLSLHPEAAERRRIVDDPSPLFRLGYFDAFGIGVAAWSVVGVLTSVMVPFWPHAPWEAAIFFIFCEVMIPALVLTFAIGAIGIGVWRGTFASLMGGNPTLKGGGWLGAALVAGSLPGLILNIVNAILRGYTGRLDFSHYVADAYKAEIFESIILLIGCFLIFRWIADASWAWLKIVLGNRSPRLISGLTIGAAFILVIIALALTIWIVKSSIIMPFFKGSMGKIAVYDLYVGGPLIFALLLTWAFPLAPLWWQQSPGSTRLASWVFLDASSAPVPQQEPLRLSEVLITGVIAGLCFWLMWQVIHFRNYFPPPLADGIGSAFDWLLSGTARTFGDKNLLLPSSWAAFQALAAAIAAARTRRLSAICGLFAASIAGGVIATGDVIFFIGDFWAQPREQMLGLLAYMGQGAIVALPTAVVATLVGGAVRRVFARKAGAQRTEGHTNSLPPIGDPRSSAVSKRKRHRRALATPSFSKIFAAILCAVVGIGMAVRLRDELPRIQRVGADLAAAEYGDAAAQYKLGIMYARGQSVARDDAQAVSWLHKAAEQGHAAAEYGLASMYASGRGVPKDDGLAFQWLRFAAEQGHAEAQNVVGSFYALGRGTPRDDAAAVHWLRDSAAQGNADAQNNLEMMYQQGRAVPKDDAQALGWFRKAAEHGHADAENNLGLIYASGRGVAEDDATALQWFRRAAEQGHLAAQSSVGLFYALGRGTLRDDAAAVQWLRKSAEHGYADAQNNLAIMYQLGRALPKDDALALQWFRRAAEQGHAEAQFHVAEAYQKGEVVARDDEQAVMWFRKAAEKSYSEARARLQAMCNTGLLVACSTE
jgi:TPR repeat protein/Zn-dependent protease with chaperone function